MRHFFYYKPWVWFLFMAAGTFWHSYKSIEAGMPWYAAAALYFLLKEEDPHGR